MNARAKSIRAGNRDLPSRQLGDSATWRLGDSIKKMLLPHTRIPPALLGKLGEARAAWHYRLRGYSIAGRNVRSSTGEIDLVARRGKTIAIVEVKTRQTYRAGEGHEAVDRKKRERMFRLGDRYAARHPEAQLRYDIVSVRWTGWRFVLTCYFDAFRPVADPHRPWQWRG